jgi:hypothetical protein
LGEEHRSFSSSLCSFLDSRYLVPLMPNITLKHLSLHSSSIRVTKPHTHTKQKQNYCSIYILMFKVLDSKWKTKDSAPNDSKHSLTSVCS